MKPATYICERFPKLSIGSTKERSVKFHLGRFVATEKWQAKIIENNEWFGCFITKAEDHTIEPIPTGGALPIPKPQRDGSGNDPEDKTEDELEEAAKGFAREPDPKAEPEPAPEYKVSDTALAILEKVGMSVPKAAAVLDLADGDRITVKMAESLEALNE